MLKFLPIKLMSRAQKLNIYAYYMECKQMKTPSQTVYYAGIIPDTFRYQHIMLKIMLE